MGKTDGHPLKDVIIKPPRGSVVIGLPTPMFSNGKVPYGLDLNRAAGKQPEVTHDKKASAKKGNLKRVETGSTSAFKSKGHPKFEPIFRTPEPASSPCVRGCNKRMKTCVQEGSSSRFQQESASQLGGSVVPEAKRGTLILMSCLNCYLHVMVSDANPKCPKCGKGDCLLDMYRV